VSFIKKFQIRYRYSLILLRELVITDFKLRYQGSVLGYLWSLLKPLALFTVLYFVFVRFLKFGTDIPHFPIYLLLGIVLWNFFVEVTTGSVSAISGKGDLIRKINFPKYVIILATSVSALINLTFNFAVVILFMIIFGASPSILSLIAIPLLIVELYFMGLACGFFLSAAQVRFKDIGYIWEVLIQMAFYATPILYPMTKLTLPLQQLSILNPAAQIIQDARYFLVTPVSVTGASLYPNQLIMRLIPFFIVLFLIIFGGLYFRNRSKNFAEDV